MKKLISIASILTVFLFMAVPTLARGKSHGGFDYAEVFNSSYAIADTGGNSQSNIVSAEGVVDPDIDIEDDSSSRNMTTGSATAESTAVVIANSDRTSVDAAGTVNVNVNDRERSRFARICNDSAAEAYTGYNYQDNVVSAGNQPVYIEIDNDSSTRTLNTGSANSRSNSWVVANSNWRTL
jgi:hypothetical protein